MNSNLNEIYLRHLNISKIVVCENIKRGIEIIDDVAKRDNINCTYFFGPSGSGKSRLLQYLFYYSVQKKIHTIFAEGCRPIFTEKYLSDIKDEISYQRTIHNEPIILLLNEVISKMAAFFDELLLFNNILIIATGHETSFSKQFVNVEMKPYSFDNMKVLEKLIVKPMMRFTIEKDKIIVERYGRKEKFPLLRFILSTSLCTHLHR